MGRSENGGHDVLERASSIAEFRLSGLVESVVPGRLVGSEAPAKRAARETANEVLGTCARGRVAADEGCCGGAIGERATDRQVRGRSIHFGGLGRERDGRCADRVK